MSTYYAYFKSGSKLSGYAQPIDATDFAEAAHIGFLKHGQEIQVIFNDQEWLTELRLYPAFTEPHYLPVISAASVKESDSLLYCSVAFLNQPTVHYSYKTFVDGLQKGDLVAVEARDSYGLARFVRYTDPQLIATKYLVGKVDLEKHTRNIAKKTEEN